MNLSKIQGAIQKAKEAGHAVEDIMGAIVSQNPTIAIPKLVLRKAVNTAQASSQTDDIENDIKKMQGMYGQAKPEPKLKPKGPKYEFHPTLDTAKAALKDTAKFAGDVVSAPFKQGLLYKSAEATRKMKEAKTPQDKTAIARGLGMDMSKMVMSSGDMAPQGQFETVTPDYPKPNLQVADQTHELLPSQIPDPQNHIPDVPLPKYDPMDLIHKTLNGLSDSQLAQKYGFDPMMTREDMIRGVVEKIQKFLGH